MCYFIKVLNILDSNFDLLVKGKIFASRCFLYSSIMHVNIDQPLQEVFELSTFFTGFGFAFLNVKCFKKW